MEGTPKCQAEDGLPTAEISTWNAGQKSINLALQGGGSHGALIWGVLDRLLEEEHFIVDGISAASAGSMNAVVLAYGLSVGGREGATNALAHFWRRISALGACTIFQPITMDKMTGYLGLDYPVGDALASVFFQFLSPHQLNPLNFNPLKNVLEEVIDFERIRQQRVIKLYLSATNVRTGKLKIFCGRELTASHVLASSCTPFLMHAVEIDGESYWDGGLTGNPALFPLIYECDSRDILLVHLTPTQRPNFPTTANSILSRMQEVSLNSSLIREMRAVVFVNSLVNQGRMTGGKQIFVHVIEAEDVVRELPNTSKMNTDWDFLLHLRDIGRKRADDWLASKFESVGLESSVDLQAKYL